MYNVLIAVNSAEDFNTINSTLDKRHLVFDVAVATSFDQAYSQIKKRLPDFAIVGPSMFAIEEKIERRYKFPVIVIGHSSECAITAFDKDACDFVMTPVVEDRLHTAINRVIKGLNKDLTRENLNLQLQNHYLSDKLTQKERKKLVIRETGRIRLIDQNTIRYVKGAGNYVEIYLNNDNKIMHRGTLRSIENELDSNLFCRIHKSALIKMSLVEELRPTSKGDYRVRLRGGDDLTLSRNNKDKLKVLLENAEPIVN